jgi:1,2-phenylacetyl-CoA epoxidase PaaB subunit
MSIWAWRKSEIRSTKSETISKHQIQNKAHQGRLEQMGKESYVRLAFETFEFL